MSFYPLPTQRVTSLPVSSSPDDYLWQEVCSFTNPMNRVALYFGTNDSISASIGVQTADGSRDEIPLSVQVPKCHNTSLIAGGASERL